MNKLLVGGGVLGLIVGGALLAAGLAKVGDGGPAKLTWREPEVKPTLMTLGYKVYANPEVEFGRHYLSKVIFKNEGQQPLSEFSIRYMVEGQISWTEPEVTREIPAGFTFVKLFYPSLPSEVSKMRNATKTNLLINVRWKEAGKDHDETIKRLITLRGVNELAYCDLPKNEVESWYDAFSASKFAVAMVTPNDPVVHRYTSEIMKYSGGTTAGAGGGPEEIRRLCGWIYDYMCASGLVYASATGVPNDYADISTYVQNVRLPRDVIENNQGLCIELAMLWCSILEHLGVRSALIMIPGHAFVIAYAPDKGIPIGAGLPIECTAINPRSVGRDAPVSFAEAVQMASQTLEKQRQQGLVFPLPVHEIQAMGFTPPELPDKDITKLGEMLALRTARPAQNTPQVVVVQPQNNIVMPNQPNTPGPVQPNTPMVPAGYTQWRHPQGHLSMALPQDFVQLAPPGTFGIVVLSVGNPATSSEVDVMQVAGTQDPQQALNYVASVFGQMGAMVQVTGSSPGENGATYFNGTTTSTVGTSRWVCVAKPVAGGQVVLVSAGASMNSWQSQSALLQSVLSTVRFN